MPDWFWTNFQWLAITIGVMPFVLSLGWMIVEDVIRPLLIPRAEIERLADNLMRRSPEDPEMAALIEEHAAWYRSLGHERGQWRRVRKVIRRRLRKRSTLL